MNGVERVMQAAAVALSVWIAAVTYQPDLDLLSEWLTARAARVGIDPYLTVGEIATQLGVEKASPFVHPRTPAALLLMQPVGMLPYESLPIVGVVGTVLPLVVAAWLMHPRAVEGVAAGSEWVGWYHNGSLLSFGVPTVVIGTLAASFLVWWPRDTIVRASLPMSMLVAPIAWIQYLPLVLIAVSPWWWAATAILVAWVGVRTYATPAFTFGLQTLASTTVALAAVWWDGRAPSRGSDGPLVGQVVPDGLTVAGRQHRVVDQDLEDVARKKLGP